MRLTKTNKAQGLPLNTIVIAILVLIVLLVIVLFFTGSFGEQSDAIGDTGDSARVCSTSNPIIGGLYEEIQPQTGTQCEEEWTQIPGMAVEDDQVCCGK